MRSARLDRAIPLGLAAAAFVLALLQRPGWASSDTKIDLHVDPGAFLADVANVWTQSGALGHVQGGQYGGYLFPMGPFFWLGDALGLAPWLTHRLWLGALLAISAWGVVRLVDALVTRERGVAHLIAGAIYLLNPYVVIFSNRTSVTLLGYALLPWLLLVVHRGVRTRDGRGWWLPGAFALLVTSSGGGVNAAVTAWLLLGPALLAIYEPLCAGVPWRAVRAFVWRTAVVSILASIWWIVPVAVQAAYGINFLQFTEQPGVIWGASSLSENLRLMGYWISYIGVGFTGELRPYLSDGPVYLFKPVTLIATFALPALCLLGFVWTRRWRYGPFFMALLLVAVVVIAVGFPEGTPLRETVTWLYYQVESVQFLRTTYKAAPLTAIALAMLGGVAVGELWRRLGGRRSGVVALGGEAAAGARGLAARLRLRPPAGWSPRARHGALAAVAAGCAIVLVLVAWPLVRGRAVDEQLMWKEIPPAWTEAGRDLDRELPPNTRAVVLPGQLFGFYDWGATVDPILPVVTDRPVAVRNIVPYADLHAIDLLWAVDQLIEQQRAVPGQLAPLARLLGAGAVLAASDDDRVRSAAINPSEAGRTLAGQRGFERPDASYGPARRFDPQAGNIGRPVALPQVRRYDVAGTRGIVRAEPLSPSLLVDGSAQALLGLAAFGSLPDDRALFYAGDLSADQARATVARGGEVVISDSNRRRVFVASRLGQNTGPTIAAGDESSSDAPVLNPFAERGADGQTVQVLDGARHIRSLVSPGFPLFPERRAYAAFDGDVRTAWIADRTLIPDRRWIEIRFERPRDVPYVDVVPYNDVLGRVRSVRIGDEEYRVRPGVNRLPVDLRDVDSLRITMGEIAMPSEENAGGGGLREVRVPGVRVSEALRPPVLAERALAGRDLRRSTLTYLFERTRGDDPYRRTDVTGPQSVGRPRDRGDAESGIRRAVAPPAARTFRADAWLKVAGDAPDDALDRMAGYRGDVRFVGSPRFQGTSAHRASSAFAGDPRRPWLGSWVPGTRPAWLGVVLPRAITLDRFTLTPPRGVRVRVPLRVRVRTPGGTSPVLPISPRGEVRLPRPLRARALRVEIVTAVFPRGTNGRERERRAVGVGALRIPGVARPRIPVAGPLDVACGAAAVRVLGAGTLAMRPTGSVAALDAGSPLRALPCGRPLALPARTVTVDARPGLFQPDLLRLRSPAPAGVPAPVGGGRVTDPGESGGGSWEDVKVDLGGPSWLVLGESYNRGWTATCDGRELGEPTPIDGYANGWRAPGDCRSVSFDFAPNAWVRFGYVLSAIVCLILLALLARALWRRRRARAAGAVADDVLAGPSPTIPDLPIPRWGWPRAALVSVPAGLALGFCFAARATPIFIVLVFLVLWRGIGPRPLIAAAAAILAIVVPLAYLLFGGEDDGGYAANFAIDHIEGHWPAVLTVVLLLLALGRALVAARRSAVDREPGPPPPRPDKRPVPEPDVPVASGSG